MSPWACAPCRSGRRHAETTARAIPAVRRDLDEFHGQATGVFSAGRAPRRHAIRPRAPRPARSWNILFSLATALEAGARTRRSSTAGNGSPSTPCRPARGPNEWGHQYDQQANQVICHVTEDRPYTNNGPDANTFGLAPHFGCCTANRHQGWPKFAARLWMRAARRRADRPVLRTVHCGHDHRGPAGSDRGIR